MIGPLRLTRVGVSVGLPLLAAALLSLPSTTDESADPSTPPVTPAVVLAAEAPACVPDIPLNARAGARPTSPTGNLGSPGVGGMLIGIDPETGEQGMPTPEQMKELSGLQQMQIDHSAAGLVEVHHPDGSVSVDLQGRFQEYATVRVGPDGKLIFQCVDGADNAERALQSPAPARPASEER